MLCPKFVSSKIQCFFSLPPFFISFLIKLYHTFKLYFTFYVILQGPKPRVFGSRFPQYPTEGEHIVGGTHFRIYTVELTCDSLNLT